MEPNPPSTSRLSDEQRLDWLRLIRAENVGPRTFRSLLNQFGGAGPAIRLLPELARRGGRTLIRIPSRDEAEAEFEAAAEIGVRYVALGEPEYPPLLRHIDDAPPLLAVRGNPAILQRHAIAIVGARNASAAGARYAGQLARAFGDAGFAVISGLARGIDAAAHRATVETGTVAVLAGGQARPYPAEHVDLLDELLRAGAAVSEMPHGWEPRARDFPRRNRIIAGLAIAVVVVEAAERSGSLITARLAGEQGREVFAVPGSPLDPRTAGTNRLIRQGATLVLSPEDVLEAIRPMLDGPALKENAPPAPVPTEVPLTETGDLRGRVLSLLGPTPVSLDDLVREAREPAAAVQIAILELELGGLIERHGGGLVSLR